MSSNARKVIGVILLGVSSVAGWLLLNWSGEPRRLSADPPPDSPTTVSVMFVLDSSPNMFPWDGYDYFQLAKDGILQILRDEELTDDGRYEFGLVQYCQPGSPGYVQGSQSALGIQHGTVHWFAPTWISGEDALTQAIAWVEDMEPCTHFTRGMFDMGIKSAAAAVANSSADQKHILYIGTGEYRLPLPCPTAAYDTKDNAEQAVCSYANGQYGLHGAPSNCAGGRCNRVCDIRHHSELAHASQVSLSAVQVGPKFNHGDGCGREEPEPYGEPPTYCNGFLQHPDAQYHPNREGFLQELVRWDASIGKSCVGYEGRYARVAPAISFGSEGIVSQTQDSVEQRITDEIAESIRQALCVWADDDDQDGDGVANLCDNCPHISNPRQRDCDENGIGDLCHTEEECGDQPGDMNDDDLDGLCNGLDTCDGGDDCLARFWLEKDPSYTCADPVPGEPLDLSTCGCDCDSDGTLDLCQAALQSADETLPQEGATGFTETIDESPTDGIPDCAQGQDPTCRRFPHACDLDSFTDKSYTLVPDIDFSLDELASEGWQWSGGMVSLATIPYTQPCSDEAIPKHLVLSPVPDAVLTGPTFALPDKWPCEVCSPDYPGSQARCPLVGAWSYPVVELDVMIANGSEWYVVIQDGCNSHKRAHVRLRGLGNNGVFVRQAILPDYVAATACSEFEGWCRADAISANTWTRLQIVLNNTDAYDLAPNQFCLAADSRDVKSLSVCTKNDNCGCNFGFKLMYESDYDPSIPDIVFAPVNGGLQIQIYPGEGTSGSLALGAVRMLPGTACDFWDPCDLPEFCSHCRCNDARRWECDGEAGRCSDYWP